MNADAVHVMDDRKSIDRGSIDFCQGYPLIESAKLLFKPRVFDICM